MLAPGDGAAAACSSSRCSSRGASSCLWGWLPLMCEMGINAYTQPRLTAPVIQPSAPLPLPPCGVITTATYTGPITVCPKYPPLAPGVSHPKMLHYEGGAWKNITTSTNTATRTVCGVVPSLSPFALGYEVSGSATSDPHLVGANGAWGRSAGAACLCVSACVYPSACLRS
jgi:hypothetical protein